MHADLLATVKVVLLCRKYYASAAFKNHVRYVLAA